MTGMGTAERLERARQASARRAWEDAYRSFSSADALCGDDLVRLAEAAYMLGRGNEYLRALERAYHAHVEAGAVRGRSAVRSGQG